MRRTLCDLGLLAVCLTWAAPPALGQVPDHLKCYKIKDSLPKTTYTADLGGLVAEPGCTIKVPATMACVPATKTNVVPAPPGGGGTGTPNSFFCYKVKCPKATLPPLAGTDQFGTRTVTPSKAKLLCAPLAGASTTTTSTSTTTTTITLMTGCPLPATGQMTCWDSSGNVITCTGTGQDGDLRKGAPLAYMDNGDGTITDVNTGLMWEKHCLDGSVHDTGTTYTWDFAFSAHVATLNTMSFAGHADWRLPNIKEIMSIVNYENAAPKVSPAFNNGCVSGCTVTTCSCIQSSNYWSSTTASGFPQDAFYVDFFLGAVDEISKGTHQYVRAVRGGS